MIGKNNKEVKLSFKDILKHNFIFFFNPLQNIILKF